MLYIPNILKIILEFKSKIFFRNNTKIIILENHN